MKNGTSNSSSMTSLAFSTTGITLCGDFGARDKPQLAISYHLLARLQAFFNDR